MDLPSNGLVMQGFDAFFVINLNKLLKIIHIVGDLRHHDAHMASLKINQVVHFCFQNF